MKKCISVIMILIILFANSCGKAADPSIYLKTEESEVSQSSESNNESTSDSAQSVKEIMYATQNCRIRKEPDIEAETIGLIGKGTSIEVTDEVLQEGEKWFKVATDEAGEGFIMEKYLTE